MYPSHLFVPVKLPAAVVRLFKSRSETKSSKAQHSIRRAVWRASSPCLETPAAARSTASLVFETSLRVAVVAATYAIGVSISTSRVDLREKGRHNPTPLEA